jgi:hypothetical protein
MSEVRHRGWARVQEACAVSPSPPQPEIRREASLRRERAQSFGEGKTRTELHETRVLVFEKHDRWVADVGTTCLPTTKCSSQGEQEVV